MGVFRQTWQRRSSLRRNWVGSKGSTHYNASVSESLTASDATKRSTTNSRATKEVRAYVHQGLPYLFAEVPRKAFAKASAITTHNRSIAQSITLSESTKRFAALKRGPIESLSFSDSIKRSSVVARKVSDTISLSDSTKRVLVLARPIVQTLTTSDETTKVVETAEYHVVESIPLSEVPARFFIGARVITQTVSTSDAATRGLGYKRGISQALTLLDAVTRAQTTSRSTNDLLTLSDEVARSGETAGERHVNEILVMTDTALRVIAALRSDNTIITLEEKPTRQTNAQRGILLATSISEAVHRSVAQSRNTINTLSILDNVKRFYIVSRSLSETLEPQDSLSISNQISGRSIVEPLTLIDAIGRVPILNRNIEDFTSITDLVTRIGKSNFVFTNDEVTGEDDIVIKVYSGIFKHGSIAILSVEDFVQRVQIEMIESETSFQILDSNTFILKRTTPEILMR